MPTRTTSTDVQRPSSDPHAQAVDRAAALVLEGIPQLMRWIRAGTRAETAPALSVPQVRALLLLLRAPGSSVSAVAEHQGVGLASASAMIDRLVRQGYVDRTTDPTERRRVRLTLTDSGTQRLRIVAAGSRRAMAHVLRDRSESELELIGRAMELLLMSIGSMDPIEARRAGSSPPVEP